MCPIERVEDHYDSGVYIQLSVKWANPCKQLGKKAHVSIRNILPNTFIIWNIIWHNMELFYLPLYVRQMLECQTNA